MISRRLAVPIVAALVIAATTLLLTPWYGALFLATMATIAGYWLGLDAQVREPRQATARSHLLAAAACATLGLVLFVPGVALAVQGDVGGTVPAIMGAGAMVFGALYAIRWVPRRNTDA